MREKQKAAIEVKGTEIILINRRFKLFEFEGFGNRAFFRQIVGTPSPQSRIFYANGVPSSSPGLRGTRYPGSSSHPTTQPQRGCVPCDVQSTPPDGTALQFDSAVAPVPRVGLIPFGQPWAEGRKPVGLELFYANGVSPSSPGLRSPDRYPGKPSRHTIQPQSGCVSNVSSRALETERTKTLTALDGFLTGLGYLK